MHVAPCSEESGESALRGQFAEFCTQLCAPMGGEVEVAPEGERERRQEQLPVRPGLGLRVEGLGFRV